MLQGGDNGTLNRPGLLSLVAGNATLFCGVFAG